jgi:hypothetical protein
MVDRAYAAETLPPGSFDTQIHQMLRHDYSTLGNWPIENFGGGGGI